MLQQEAQALKSQYSSFFSFKITFYFYHCHYYLHLLTLQRGNHLKLIKSELQICGFQGGPCFSNHLLLQHLPQIGRAHV